MTCEDLLRAKTELSQVREELSLCSAQTEKMRLQVMLFTDKTFNFLSHIDKNHRGTRCRLQTCFCCLDQVFLHSLQFVSSIKICFVCYFCFLQFDSLQEEFKEETKKLRGDVERSKEESRELTLQAEMSRLQAEENQQQVLRLSEQLEEMKKKQEVQVYMAESQRGNVNHIKPVKHFQGFPSDKDCLATRC